mmetsp:Transcript_10780/g.23707  ORF Transcript_10780/g.23707 Transcript_10780/m.23707 type:complete len:92 (-) Transcript_10780:238-513(-)
MTLTSTPSSAPNTTTKSNKDTTITPLQLSLAALILGASAGLTLYTKRTSTMLNQLERASKNAQQRKGPERFGPMTRGEWEKMRNRWEKDDL